MKGFRRVFTALGQHGPLAVALVTLLALGFLALRPQPADNSAAFTVFNPPPSRVAFMAPSTPPRPASLLTPEGVARAYIYALVEGNPDAVIRLSRPGSRSIDLTPGYGVPGFGLIWLDIRELSRAEDRVEFEVRGMLADGNRQDPVARRPFQGRLTICWAEGSWYVARADLATDRT